jgi:hypothetical protein
MLYLRLIILSVRDDVFIDSDTVLVTDFVNLKIKSAQYFRCVHKCIMYVHKFIGINALTCRIICIYIVFLKKWDSTTG